MKKEFYDIRYSFLWDTTEISEPGFSDPGKQSDSFSYAMVCFFFVCSVPSLQSCHELI